MRRFRSITILVAGVLLGIVLGTAGVGNAAFSYQAWHQLSEDFKNGYIVGFLAMAKLARNADPSGWVDKHYPLVKDAKPVEYRRKLDELYAKPENQKYNIDSMFQLVAHELGKTHKVLTGEERQIMAMRDQLTQMRKAQIARLQSQGKPIPPELLQPLPENPDLTVKPPKTPPKPKGVSKAPKPRKWCRCDGKDPKAERAKRRAARAAAQQQANPADKDAKPIAPPPGPAPADGLKKPAEPRSGENLPPSGAAH